MQAFFISHSQVTILKRSSTSRQDQLKALSNWQLTLLLLNSHKSICGPDVAEPGLPSIQHNVQNLLGSLMMRLLFVIVFTTLLAACATTGANVPRNSKVVPISIVGNTLDFRVVGTTVFGNDKKLIDVSEWNTDENIEDSANNYLRTAGINSGRAAPGSKSHIGAMSFLNFTGNYSFAGGKEGVQKAALGSNADYLLIVARAPNAFSDPFFHTNQYITGYGIYQRSYFGRQSGVNFVQLAILLVDGKTGEVITSRVRWLSSPRAESLWVDNEHTTPDAANLAETKKALMPLIDGVVNNALVDMKILGER
ncbi:MAG TPA: hypothetical protein VFK88_01900 [Gallionella sp.]|nr:hypothetical protein [Gallionella sp.]